MKNVIIKIESLANGEASPFDGRYVVEYEPDPREGQQLVVNGRPLGCHIQTTADEEEATRFEFRAAHALWTAVSKTAPVRPWDGRPNRPLTAFTVTFLARE